MSKTLVIYGCGGHAKSIADVAEEKGYSSIYFVDHSAQENEKILDYMVIPHPPAHIVFDMIIGIGNNQKRALAFEQFSATDFPITTLIAKGAYVSQSAILQRGIFVARGVHIGPNALISANTLLNTYAVIEHDVQIGKHCHISVNATIAGKSQIGDLVMVGAGATIIDNITICSNVTVGAGAVVIHNISEPGTYVGVPAYKKK